MTDREIILDGLPAPGEPLQRHIHEDNQRLLDEEIAERARRVQAKLGWWEAFWLNRQYHRLWKQLNRAGYNALVKERYELMQDCIRLRYESSKAASPADRHSMRLEMQTKAAKGLKLDLRLDELKPLIEAFETVSGKLKSHAEVLKWEREDTENKAAFRREAVVWLEQMKACMRQTPRLHRAWDDEEGKHHIDIPIFEHMLFKEDRVLYQVRTSAQTWLERFFGNRWHSDLPYGVDVKNLACDETLENLSAHCNRIVTVERSKSGTNFFYCISRLDAPDGIPKKVLYQKTIDWYPREDQAKTPWAAGVSNDRKVIWYNFEDQPHILIAGTTQSGKSNHLNTIIATSVTMNSPKEVRVLFIDLKGGVELTHWEGVKHALRPMVRKKEDVLEALQWVRGIMEKRLARFEKMKAKNLASFNHRSRERLPRIIVFIDELATLIGLGTLTSDIHNEMAVLTSQGRAAGVHLVVCTQHPSREVLIGRIKTNLPMRIAGKMLNHTASEIILDTGSATLLPAVPGRMVFSVGHYEVVAQSPFISDAEIERSVKLSHSLYPEPIDDSEFDAEAVAIIEEKFSKEMAIELALTRLDGSLSSKRIHEIVGNDVITRRKLDPLINELISEIKSNGGIEVEGVRYQVRKLGKGFYLEPLPQHHDDSDDGDTAEIIGIEQGIETEEPLEEAVV
jgi:hypothetical protein